MNQSKVKSFDSRELSEFFPLKSNREFKTPFTSMEMVDPGHSSNNSSLTWTTNNSLVRPGKGLARRVRHFACRRVSILCLHPLPRRWTTETERSFHGATRFREAKSSRNGIFDSVPAAIRLGICCQTLRWFSAVDVYSAQCIWCIGSEPCPLLASRQLN